MEAGWTVDPAAHLIADLDSGANVVALVVEQPLMITTRTIEEVGSNVCEEDTKDQDDEGGFNHELEGLGDSAKDLAKVGEEAPQEDKDPHGAERGEVKGYGAKLVNSEEDELDIERMEYIDEVVEVPEFADEGYESKSGDFDSVLDHIDPEKHYFYKKRYVVIRNQKAL